MGIRKDQLSFSDQLKLCMLSKEDQADVLNSKTTDEAIKKLNDKKKSIRLEVGSYEPKLQVSGSSVKYKTKNLFTDVFDEQDVKDFIILADMSSNMEEEVVKGELKRKIRTMSKEGKQPLQCMVYSTKQNEKVFYNNDKKVRIWAQVIADTVNSNKDYVSSINHMLVNWEIWKHQITLLITACEYIKHNEKLDEVIRDLYLNYEDDKVKYTVIKRLLHGLNLDNYLSAFVMLKNVDFISSDTDRKYINALKKKIENATQEERKALYDAYRSVQGFNGPKRKWIETLFGKNIESELVKRINESRPEEKDIILREVNKKVYGSTMDYREVSMQARNIKQYRNEIQEMFMQKLDKSTLGLEDIKTYGLAICDLDSKGKAIPFIKEQMSLCNDEAKQLMFCYVLAVMADSYIDSFINAVLRYDGIKIKF